MKKSLFVLAMLFVLAIAPSCSTGYDEVENNVIPEQTSDPDTGTAGGGPVNPPPPPVGG